MNINCTICSDLFTPTSLVYITKCGHTFHHECLLQWLQRSKSCPQCRHKTSEKSIFRVYFNFLTSDGIQEDAVTLQNKLDCINLQLSLQNNEIKQKASEIISLETEKEALKNEIAEKITENSVLQSGFASLKDKLSFYKDKVRHVEKLETEVQQLKEKLRQQENAATAFLGTFEEANAIISRTSCVKTLSVIASSLKKELEATVRKKNNLFLMLRSKETELATAKKKILQLEEENKKLNIDLSVHQQCDERFQKLRQVISEMQENPPTDSSLKRIMNESPISLPKKSILKPISYVDSPSIVERIKEIKASSSPYLNVKPSSMSLLLKSQDSSSKYVATSSLFKKSLSGSSLSPTRSPEGSYNGLGGHSKEDVFPNPQLSRGLKRTKSSIMTSSKLKRLAKPSTSSFKWSDFLDITD